MDDCILYFRHSDYICQNSINAMSLTSIALELNHENKAYKIYIPIHIKFLRIFFNWMVYYNYNDNYNLLHEVVKIANFSDMDDFVCHNVLYYELLKN
jgi:hypothetical protein